MKWQKKLTKSEMKHFRYATNRVMTLTAFRKCREGQKEIDSTKEVCYDCRHIAVKLGIE